MSVILIESVGCDNDEGITASEAETSQLRTIIGSLLYYALAIGSTIRCSVERSEDCSTVCRYHHY